MDREYIKVRLIDLEKHYCIKRLFLYFIHTMEFIFSVLSPVSIHVFL